MLVVGSSAGDPPLLLFLLIWCFAPVSGEGERLKVLVLKSSLDGVVGMLLQHVILRGNRVVRLLQHMIHGLFLLLLLLATLWAPLWRLQGLVKEWQRTGHLLGAAGLLQDVVDGILRDTLRLSRVLLLLGAPRLLQDVVDGLVGVGHQW